MMAALYVGNLHPDVTEALLLEKFGPAGCIYSIKLCRDRNTGSSLKYAYINFQQRADAEQALEMLNFDLLLGRPMRIMWSQRDSSLRNSSIGNIFIKNLDKSIDSMALYDTFSTFGKILACKVVGYATGSKGYGYIHFESADAAERAIERLNGKLLNERKVFIEHFKPRNERQAEMGPRPAISLFIKNLGQDVDDKRLTDIFSKFGPLVSVRVMRDENGRSQGFGFVQFARHEYAQKAVDEINGKEVNGVKICVGVVQNKAKRQAEIKEKYEQGLNLYVKNLDASVDDECLRKAFLPFGTIINAKVMMENGCSKGFGFVHFAFSEEAMNAIKGMQGRMWGSKPLYVGVFKRKEERQAYHVQQQTQRMASMQAQNVAAYYGSSQMVTPLANPYSYWNVNLKYVQTMSEAAQNVPTMVQYVHGAMQPINPMMQQQSYGMISPVNTEEQCTCIMCTYTTGPTAADTIPVADAVPAVDIAVAVAMAVLNTDVDTVPAVDTVKAVEPAPASVEVSGPAPAEDKRPEPAAPEVLSPAPAALEVSGPAPAEVVNMELAAPEVLSPTPAVVEVPGPAPAEVVNMEPAAPDVPCPAPVEAPATGDPSKPSEFDVATNPLPRKRLTIYMLESAPVDEQVQMAYDYMLPLVEEIHPTLARKITWMLLEGENNYNIMNMIGIHELLRAKVDEMDALLKAREAGHKPETLKMMYNINNINKKRKNKRKKK